MTKNNDQNKNQNLIDDLEIETVNKEEADSQPAESSAEENIIIAKAKIILIKKLITNIKENNDQLLQLLSAFISKEEEERISIAQVSDEKFDSASGEENVIGGRIIEGVFDGENMIGPDGKQYSIPANYASKSKLVEGDIMKLTITSNGTFIYKQIGPIERIRLVGELEQSTSGNYIVKIESKHWKVLTASVTYYKGQAGDEVVILVPKNGESNWAAVENIVRKTS
ncbi:MAG: hypothetical protein NTW06_02425 [Candidatus Falkowbacteria bacterium]|nr:hypothetical protein [Candidatus Falkowbacteria bacterium]